MRLTEQPWSFILGLGLLLATCGGDSSTDRCADKDVDLDVAIPKTSPSGPLPDWAIGEFGVHSSDIHNLLISSDGGVVYALDGGDYGGCGTLAASFVDDRVVITNPETTPPRTMFVIARVGTTPYIHLPSVTSCDWYTLQTTTVCGRDVGGCGGFGSSEPCSWAEGGCVESLTDGADLGDRPDTGVAD